MPDAPDLRRALAAHLEFYRDLGVDGIHRDPIWTMRPARARGDARDADVPDAAAAEPPELHSSEPMKQKQKPPAVETPSAIQTISPIAIQTRRDLTSGRIVLQEIREDIGDCTRCKLHGLGRQQIVFGVGNPNAELMFVGEAPGRDEDVQGEPFVGRAGQLLTKIIEAIGLTRADVYIANVIKCRPPENRNPEPDEVASCEPFLFRQIDAIKPRVIVALGTFAAQCLLKTNLSISRLRGRTHLYRGTKLIATFHPAFLLRSPERKRDTWEDMKRVRDLLRGDPDDDARAEPGGDADA